MGVWLVQVMEVQVALQKSVPTIYDHGNSLQSKIFHVLGKNVIFAVHSYNYWRSWSIINYMTETVFLFWADVTKWIWKHFFVFTLSCEVVGCIVGRYITFRRTVQPSSFPGVWSCCRFFTARNVEILSCKHLGHCTNYDSYWNFQTEECL